MISKNEIYQNDSKNRDQYRRFREHSERRLYNNEKPQLS